MSLRERRGTPRLNSRPGTEIARKNAESRIVFALSDKILAIPDWAELNAYELISGRRKPYSANRAPSSKMTFREAPSYRSEFPG